MLETLKQKLLSWTPEGAAAFRNNLVSYGMYSNAIWEITPTGYYIIHPIKTEYRDYNGTRYVLQGADVSEDLSIKQRLADYASETNQAVLYERPNTIEVVEIYGSIFTYSVQTNPFQTRGINLINLSSVPLEQRAEVALEMMKQICVVYDQVSANLTALEITNFPYTLPADQIYLDTASNKFFVTGEIPFGNSKTEWNNFCKFIITNINALSPLMFDKNLNIKSALEDFVRNTCTTIQLP